MENCPFCDAPGAYREATDGSCYVCGMMLPGRSGTNAPGVATDVIDHAHVLNDDDAAKDVEKNEDDDIEITEVTDIPNSERDEPTIAIDPSRAAPTVFMESSGPPAIDLIQPRNLSPEYARRVTAAWEVTKGAFKNPLETIDAKRTAQAEADRLLIGTRTVSRSEEEGRADYKLNEVIGQGAMGTVWSARQGSLDREVAIKMPRQGTGDTAFGRQLFISEVVVTGQLDHPNIVPIYDLARDETGQLFYAMKRVEGQSWDMCMHEEGRTRHDNVEILMKVCDAVRFAHDRKVLHRDIKPQNIMVGKFGEVSVMDWGIALKMPEGTQLPGNTKISPSGTPAYMAPEMATGNANEIGWHTDVYLLGAVLYEIITGEPPHPAPTSTGDSRVQQKACLLIAARNVITPAKETGELIDIAYRAMATDIYDRYQNVDEFQEAIRNYFEHAESIALTERGDAHLTNARETRNGVYEDYAKARFAFDEAIQLWPENRRARHGRSEATHDYAGSALERGDYALGLSLLSDDDPTHADLKKKLSAAKRRSERSRFITAASIIVAVAALGLGGAYSTYSYVKLARVTGKLDTATSKLADADNKLADADNKIKDAEKTTKSLEAASVELANKNKQADKDLKDKEREFAEKEKELNGRRVQLESQVTDKTAQLTAVQGVAEKAQREAKQASYRSEIGRVTDDIQSNSFKDARETLEKLKQAEAAEKTKLRNWEWGHLAYQAAEPAIVPFKVHGSPHFESVAISPDKKWIAAAADNKNVYIWNADNQELAGTIAFDSSVSALLIASDNKTLVTAAGKEVSFWSVPDGQKLNAGGALQYSEPILSVALSPVNPNVVLTSSSDGSAQTWFRDKPAHPNRVFKSPVAGAVWQARFSPDGQLIATAGDDGSVRLWTTEKGDHRTLDGHRGPVYAVEFSTDGKTLASGGRDHRVLLWDVPTPAELSAGAKAIAERLTNVVDTTQNSGYRQLGEHTAAVRCLAFSPDRKVLFTGSDDNSVGVWDLSLGALKSLRGHGGGVRTCAASSDGEHVVSGSYDGQVNLWDWKKYAFPRVLSPDSRTLVHFTSTAASPDARWIATGSAEGVVTMWDMANPLIPVPQSLGEGHDWQATTGIYFKNGDDSRLLTAGGDNSALIWDTNSGNQILRMGGWDASNGTGWRGVGAVSHHGKWIATGSNDSSILAKVWDSKTGRLVWTLASGNSAQSNAAENADAAALAFAPDDNVLFVGDQSGRGYLFDTSNGKLIKQFVAHERKVSAATFLSKGESKGNLLTASSDFTVVEWKIGGGMAQPQLVRTFKHRDRVVSMEVTEDEQHLITATDSGDPEAVLRVWNMKTGTPERGITYAKLVEQDEDLKRFANSQPDSKGVKKGDDKPLVPAIRSVALRAGRPTALVTLFDPTNGKSKYRLGTWDWESAPDSVVWNKKKLLDTSMAVYSPSPDGRILAVGGRGAREFLANNVVKSYRSQTSVKSVAFAPNSQLIASAGEDGSIKLWQFDNGSKQWLPIQKLTAHNGPVNSVMFHPKRSDLLLSASNDGKAYLWQQAANSWKATQLPLDGRGPVQQAIFSPADQNGAAEVIAAADHDIFTFNTEGRLVNKLKIDSPASCLAVSPDREWLVAGVNDQAWVWNRAALQGEPRLKLPGNPPEITALAFSQDGERLFTAGLDFHVKLWDTTAWAKADPKQPASHEVLTLGEHRESVVSLAFFPHAKYPSLLTAGADGKAILWPSVDWH